MGNCNIQMKPSVTARSAMPIWNALINKGRVARLSSLKTVCPQGPTSKSHIQLLHSPGMHSYSVIKMEALSRIRQGRVNQPM